MALNEDSNGDVNKNTENGGTKMVTDLNGSNNGRNPREIIRTFLSDLTFNLTCDSIQIDERTDYFNVS